MHCFCDPNTYRHLNDKYLHVIGPDKCGIKVKTYLTFASRQRQSRITLDRLEMYVQICVFYILLGRIGARDIIQTFDEQSSVLKMIMMMTAFWDDLIATILPNVKRGPQFLKMSPTFIIILFHLPTYPILPATMNV